MKHRMKHNWNSFSGRIIFIVVFGLGLMAFTVSLVVLLMSQKVFMDTYGKSQEKVVNQIVKEFNNLHEELLDVINTIDSSWAFRLYLTDMGTMDNIQTFQNIYQMEQDLGKSKVDKIDRLNVLVYGLNGKHYLSRTETISAGPDEILNSPAVVNALKDKEKVHYTFSHGAYSMTTKNQDVIIVSKALYYPDSKKVYAVALITLTADNLKPYYDYFVTSNSYFYMVDANDRIICSSESPLVGKKLDGKEYKAAKASRKSKFTISRDGKYLTVMRRKLPYQDCTVYAVVDNQLALAQLYNMPLLALVCFGIGGVILTICLIYTRQTIHPLSKMVQKMSRIRQGNFTECVPIEGTVEMQELAVTYNHMLDDIRNYIEELVKTQKQQRKYEIKALQMQINPHYIYNTLASIKMLVYQNDTEKTTRMIDAFICLLRNTISNADEYITVKQEIQNLENYILIMHTRYGESVKVEYYVSQNCYGCLIPKLILQPFIENAFFHAFPCGRKGTIQVFIREKEKALNIRIIDNGVGMEPQKAGQLVQRETKKEYFSGIGIFNVHDRLRLLFGDAYGVQIESKEQEGTTIIINLPAMTNAGDDDGTKTDGSER